MTVEKLCPVCHVRVLSEFGIIEEHSEGKPVMLDGYPECLGSCLPAAGDPAVPK